MIDAADLAIGVAHAHVFPDALALESFDGTDQLSGRRRTWRVLGFVVSADRGVGCLIGFNSTELADAEIQEHGVLGLLRRFASGLIHPKSIVLRGFRSARKIAEFRVKLDRNLHQVAAYLDGVFIAAGVLIVIGRESEILERRLRATVSEILDIDLLNEQHRLVRMAGPQPRRIVEDAASIHLILNRASYAAIRIDRNSPTGLERLSLGK